MSLVQEWSRSAYEEVLRRIAIGRTMTSVCQDADMPSRSSVGLRCLKDPEYAERYREACDEGKLKQKAQLAQQIMELDGQGLSKKAIAARLNTSPKTIDGLLGKDYSPLPGFPRKEKFETEDELKKYFGEEKVQCLLCGRRYRGLFQHLLKGHGVSLEEYRVMYGIPLEYGLVGEDTRLLMTEHGNNRYQEDQTKAALSKGYLLAHTPYAKQANRNVRAMPVVMANKRAAIMKAVTSPEHLSKKSQTPAMGVCCDCGEPVVTNEMALVTKGDLLLCPKCKSDRQKACQVKTPAYTTPGRMAEYQAAYYQLHYKENPGPMAAYRQKYGKDCQATEENSSECGYCL